MCEKKRGGSTIVVYTPCDNDIFAFYFSRCHTDIIAHYPCEVILHFYRTECFPLSALHIDVSLLPLSGECTGLDFLLPLPPTTHTTSSCLHCSQVMWSAGPWIGCCHGNWGGIFQGSLVTAPD